MTEKLGRIAALIFVGALLFFGAKGCIVTAWSSPPSPEMYIAESQQGQTLAIALLPGFQSMLWYIEAGGERAEGILARTRGSYGTHYFGPLWHVEGPAVSFGYRLYPSGVQPVHMEIQVLEKFKSTQAQARLPDKGTTIYELMLFGPTTIEFQGVTLNRAESEDPSVERLLAKLGGSRPLK